MVLHLKNELKLKDTLHDKAPASKPGQEDKNMEYCVCCGSPIPEGRMVCWICEHQYDEVKA